MSKDFGRKTYMETEEDDYRDVIKYNPLSQNQDKRFQRHSELLKPYDGAEGYQEMENYSPVQNKFVYRNPTVDDMAGEGGITSDPCAGNSDQFVYAPNIYVACDSLTTINIQSLFEAAGVVQGVAPFWFQGCIGLPDDASVPNSIDKYGDVWYKATKDCCFGVFSLCAVKDACNNIVRFDIHLIPTDYIGAIIIGPDAPVNGDCYGLLANGVLVQSDDIIWSISKGSIDSSGCVSGLSSECGAAVITADSTCPTFQSVTKTVRMPNGVWVTIQDFSCSTCGICVRQGGEYKNSWFFEGYDETVVTDCSSCNSACPPSALCEDDAFTEGEYVSGDCTPVMGVCNETTGQVRCNVFRGQKIEQWVCP